MSHTCHWPGCTAEVPPKMWGCRPHWCALPKRLRDRIWETYQPRQEVTKTPSPAYIQAAQEVRQWCIEHDLLELMDSCLEKRGDRYYATAVGCSKLESWFGSLSIKATVSVGLDERYIIEYTQ